MSECYQSSCVENYILKTFPEKNIENIAGSLNNGYILRLVLPLREPAEGVYHARLYPAGSDGQAGAEVLHRVLCSASQDQGEESR